MAAMQGSLSLGIWLAWLSCCGCASAQRFEQDVSISLSISPWSSDGLGRAQVSYKSSTPFEVLRLVLDVSGYGEPCKCVSVSLAESLERALSADAPAQVKLDQTSARDSIEVGSAGQWGGGDERV